MAEEAILTEVSDGVAIITINRPQARNAVNGAVARGIAAAVEEFDARADVSVLVLTGAGGTFSAGMDLKGFLTGDSPIAPGRGFGGIAERPAVKPMIAAVEGYALAGGFELVLSCDLV
ncbi:MAG TPA: enoyl-CoA hydratase-related protein, partial [Streptosporangiaceae bacterium]